MTDILTSSQKPTHADLDQMHALYRQGGKDRRMAPHVVYQDPTCPHPGCDQPMQAIDFRVEAYGRAIHDPLVVAWWNDMGFAGQCPRCRGWIHFTIRGKRPITAQEAGALPQLPADWHQKAIIL
ncbi:MAG TPA: hypothetical protein VKI17_10220 [Gemmataceae bacterium]|nr:hypothetical protein [Gemmataceae bacterium]